MDLTLILLIIALVLLILAALNISAPIHLGWAGLALVVVTFILDRTGS